MVNLDDDLPMVWTIAPPSCRTMSTRTVRSRPWLVLFGALLLVVASVLGTAAPAPAQTTPSGTAGSTDGAGGQQGTALKAQYDEVLGQEAKLEAAIEAQAQKRVEIAGQITDIEGQLRVVDLQLAAASIRLKQAVRAQAKARKALVAAHLRMRRATDALNAQAVSAYITGGDTGHSVDVLLHSFDGTTETERSSSYADAIVEHQRQVVAEFTAARAARNAASSKAKAARSGAATIRSAIAASQKDLQVKRVKVEILHQEADRAALIQFSALSQLTSKKIAIEARIVDLEKASDGIAQTLSAIQADQPDYTPGSIVFSPPIPGAKPGSPFGMRFHPILHYTRLHPGIDFGQPVGTPIRAAADGVVVIASVRGGYGNATVIDHGHSIATVYAHQSQIIVKVGQRVKAGDVIGAVGTTGLSTGPHLHFETRVRGTPVNPTNFVDFGAPTAPATSESGD